MPSGGAGLPIVQLLLLLRRPHSRSWEGDTGSQAQRAPPCSDLAPPPMAVVLVWLETLSGGTLERATLELGRQALRKLAA